MLPGRMRNGVSRSATRLGECVSAGRRGGTSTAFGPLSVPPSRRSWNEACAYGGPSGTCALVALACGLSIRPVL